MCSGFLAAVRLHPELTIREDVGVVSSFIFPSFILKQNQSSSFKFKVYPEADVLRLQTENHPRLKQVKDLNRFQPLKQEEVLLLLVPYYSKLNIFE